MSCKMFIALAAFAALAIGFIGCEAGTPKDDGIDVVSDTGVNFNLRVITRAAAPTGMCPNTTETASKYLPKKLSDFTVVVKDADSNKEIVKKNLGAVQKGQAVVVDGIEPGKRVVIEVEGKDGNNLLSGMTKVCYNPEGEPDLKDNVPTCIFEANKKRFVKITMSYAGDSGCLSDVMDVGRMFHTSTLLPNGKVLITGGFTSYNPSTNEFAATKAVELYDPQTGEFIRMGDLDRPRAMHTATLLPGGLVLIAGGTENGIFDSSSSTAFIRAVAPIDSFVIFVVSINDFNRAQGVAQARKMHIGRTLHTATCIPLNPGFNDCVDIATGREASDYFVLFAGGDGRAYDEKGQPLDIWASGTYELFVMAVEQGKLRPKMLHNDKATLKPPRIGHQTFVVGPGNAVIYGGTPAGGGEAIQRYTAPANQNEANAGNLGSVNTLSNVNMGVSEEYLNVRFPYAEKIIDGAFMLFGGALYKDGKPKFDANPLPTFFTVSPLALQEAENPNSGARVFHCVARYDADKALMIGGGQDQVFSIISAAIEGVKFDISNPQDLKAQMVTLPISLKTPRMGHTCTALPDNTVLVLGGMSDMAGRIEKTGEIINY